MPKVIAEFGFSVDPRLTAGYDFDRIPRILAPGSSPYLIDKYARCKTPRADRDAGCSGFSSLLVPDSPKASFLGASISAGKNCPNRDRH
jgi:hypothetical protein